MRAYTTQLISIDPILLFRFNRNHMIDATIHLNITQAGLHGSGKSNPFGDLPVNETFGHRVISNIRGTASIAHFDVPDSA